MDPVYEFNPLIHPTLYQAPLRVEMSSWWTHVPFAMLAIELIQPKRFVELGVHTGVSYCSMCQAAKQLLIDAEFYGIDTWEGDIQAGFYGPEVYQNLVAYHDPLYSSFSTLLRSTFDEAAPKFQPGTINLLHIDGCHDYEAVKHDFATWLPLMAVGGIIMLHDINEHQPSFGVWQLWDEIAAERPHFKFMHGHGLGVLAIDDNYPHSLEFLFKAQPNLTASIREFFAQLGERLRLNYELQQIKHTLQAQTDTVRTLESKAVQLEAEHNVVEQLKHQNAVLNAEYASNLTNVTAQLEAEHNVVEQLKHQNAVLNAEYASNLTNVTVQLEAEHNVVEQLKHQNAVLNAEYASNLTNVATQLEAEHNVVEQLKHQNAVLNAEYASNLTNVATQLEAEHNVVEQLKHQNAALSAEYASNLTNVATQLEAEHNVVEQLKHQNAALSAEYVSNLTNVATQLEAEQASARVLLASVDSRLSEFNTSQGNLSHYQAQYSELERQVVTITESTQHCERQNKELTDALRHARRDLAALEGRVALQRASRLLGTSQQLWRGMRRIRRAVLSRMGRYAAAPALFDAAWYLSQVPDAIEAAGGIYEHYVAIGWRAGFSPNPLFDAEWYRDHNPDVRKADIDPFQHYVYRGWREGRDPTPVFKLAWYLSQNPDVQKANTDPLLHYSKNGWRESRDPNPLFDTHWYLNTYPDVRHAEVEPLSHYLTVGWREGRNPSPTFDTNWYLTQYPDVARSDVNPLWHYLARGQQEGRSIKIEEIKLLQAQEKSVEEIIPLPVPEGTSSELDPKAVALLFDEQWYTRIYPDIVQSGADPLTHYLTIGWREGRRPNAVFDPRWYFQAYPEVAQAGIEPLTYYVTIGSKKGHNPSEDFDADFYLQTYPDVAKAGILPLLHYVTAGKREGRQTRRPIVPKSHTFKEYQKNSSVAQIPTSGTILVLGQDACRAGSQILLLSVIEWLVRYTALSVRLVLMRGGPLLADYEQLCDTLIISDGTTVAENDWAALIRDFAGPNLALVYANTVVSVHMIQAASSLKKPIIWHIHELKGAIERFCGKSLFQSTLPQTACIIACSDAVAACLRDDYDVSADLITTVTTFISPTSPDGYQVQQLRQQRHLDADTLVILGCGSVVWRKGPDLFVRVAAELRSRQVDGFQFIWIGLAEIPELQSRIEEIKELGLENYVSFLGEQADPSIYFGLSNIFALTSREDPFPMVALEAAFHSLPIVCFAGSGGMPNVVSEPGAEMGYVVAFEDVKTMADRIQLLLSDAGLRRWLGEQGRKKVIARYTADAKVPALLEVIREVGSIRPKLSVIVPAYNHAQFIRRRIDSILDQTFRDFEIILLDDASSDETVHILQQYAWHPNVRIVSNRQNSGSPFAQWQKGLELARADLIWIAEDDDFCESTLLESLLPYFSDPTVKLAYCQSTVLGEHDEALYDAIHVTDEFSIDRWYRSYVVEAEVEVNYCLAVKNTITNASSVVFRRFDYSQWSEAWRTAILAGDWALYLYAIQDGKIAYHPERLNYHRRHKDTATSRTEFIEKRFVEIVRVQALATRLYHISDKCRGAMQELALQVWQQVFPDRPGDEFEPTYQSLIEAEQIVPDASNVEPGFRQFQDLGDRAVSQSLDSAFHSDIGTGQWLPGNRNRRTAVPVRPKEEPSLGTETNENVGELAHRVGDVFKRHPYFEEAEPFMERQWNNLIWPLLKKIEDFSCILDLAAGHGRNSVMLRRLTAELIIVDINQECIDACKERFGNDDHIRYICNDGVTLAGVANESVSLIYSFDSIVHFDSEVVRLYMPEFYRVLKPGGYGFCHHSNFTGNAGGAINDNPHWRNYMSKELFAYYCTEVGFQIVQSKTIDWGGYSNLDCLTLFQKPTKEAPEHR